MNDAAEALQQKIRSTIPLSEALQFNIDEISLDAIRVSAPLAPNVNIHGSAFAGSIYSVAVLSGWALCMHIMEQLDIHGELVVGKAEIRYRSPIITELHCRSTVPADLREAFVGDLRALGKAKLQLQVEVGDDASAVLLGSYFAVAAAAH